MRNTARVAAAIFGVASLTLASCGERETTSADDSTPTEETSAPAQSNPDFKACIVSDSGGFNDKSFNQTSYAGLQSAEQKLGIKTGEVESNAVSEFTDNIDAMVKQNCNSITTVGFLLGDATEAAAKKNPKIDFSIVDFAYDKPPKNLKGLLFNTQEPSFLAGYLAAGMTETGTVGVLGGQALPSVTAFMEGYEAGIDLYNEENDADVQLIGWDSKSEKGTFTNDFESKTKGQSAAAEMITQGADVIMPVAGPAGLGSLQAVQDAGVKGIWVDTDGCVSAAEYCDILLSSVMKGMDVAVEEAITASLEGNFDNTPYTGTLENGGVDLAPYNEFEDEIPQELKDRIEELKQEIIDGEIKVS